MTDINITRQSPRRWPCNMNSGVYKITNTQNGKCYVGSTKCFNTRFKRHLADLRKGTHSSIKLQRAFNKYGESCFSFEVLEACKYQKPDIVNLENHYIDVLDTKSNGYNIADASFGDCLSDHPLKDEIIAKRTSTLKAKIAKMTLVERQVKYGKLGAKNGMFGKKRSAEEMAPALEAQRQFIIEHGYGYNKGIKRSDAQRAAISALAKTRTGNLNGFHNKTHTEESKKKISAATTGRKCSTLRPVSVRGIVYERLKDAEASIGMKSSTIWHRCSSPNAKFTDFFFVDQPK